MATWKEISVRRCRSVVLQLSVLACAIAASALAEAAADDAGPAAYVLSDSQLDAVTAGATVISMDLAAMAHGPVAFTSTEGMIRHLRGKILLVDTSPGGPANAGIVTQHTGELAYGVGRAVAVGGTDAAASATVGLQGHFAFLRQSSLAAVTPGSATAVVSFVFVALER